MLNNFQSQYNAVQFFIFIVFIVVVFRIIKALISGRPIVFSKRDNELFEEQMRQQQMIQQQMIQQQNDHREFMEQQNSDINNNMFQ